LNNKAVAVRKKNFISLNQKPMECVFSVEQQSSDNQQEKFVLKAKRFFEWRKMRTSKTPF
jgi:hypothetical protein